MAETLAEQPAFPCRALWVTPTRKPAQPHKALLPQKKPRPDAELHNSSRLLPVPAESHPCVYKHAAYLECRIAQVSGLDLILDLVGPGHFRDQGGVGRGLKAPVAERGAESERHRMCPGFRILVQQRPSDATLKIGLIRT